MKNMFRFSALLCAMAVLVTSCTKDETLEPQRKPAAIGDQIVFGARAGFESSNPDSRTEYTGDIYEYNNKKYEAINWVKGDMIDIYSSEVTGSNAVSYTVEKHDGVVTATDGHMRDSVTTLTPIDEGAVMKWGSNSNHTFYAMYPSGYTFANKDENGNYVTLDQGVKLEGTTMKGIVPSSYSPEVTLKDKTYVATPDMRYAYMVAKTVHDPSTQGNNVSLSFVPVVTAVEIELLFPDDQTTQEYYDIYVGQIILSSETQQLSGGFTADLSAWNPSVSATPECELDTEVTSQKYVSISTLKYNSTTGIDEPIKLNEGQSIKVTAFLLPHTDITDLKVGFTSGAATPKEKSLAAAGTIYAKVKTRITKVKLPVTAEELDPGLNDASNWMRDLVQRKPNITMAGLSLPGTGGSFTYKSGQRTSYRQQYTINDTEMYSEDVRTDSMSFDKQWALGIRAFEIASDRPTYSQTATLYDEQITCNKVDVGMKVGTAMEQIIQKVIAYPKEAAAVILLYQPEDTDPTRNAAYYAEALKAMYNTLEGKYNAADGTDIFQLYKPTTKLSDAAGHVLLMARINQRDEDERDADTGTGNGSASTNWTAATTTLSGLPILLINGCGSAKDKWGTRGYKSDGVAVDDINWGATAADEGTIMESFLRFNNDYLWGTGSYTNGVISYPYADKTVSRERSITNWFYDWSHVVSRPNPATKPTDDGFSLGFGYSTNVEYNCWYQEWARVVETPYEGSYGGNTYYWFESYYEKLNHVFMTYDMAIDNVKSDQIYVNSLCGYLVTSSIPDSYQPTIYGSTTGGQGGDIQGLAKKLTPQFYQYVLKRAQDNTTGPTGIVMMDYVSDNPDEGGSHYLPSLIIANNLKSSSN